MSHSPLDATVVNDEYINGWEAGFQLLYSGGSLSGRERNCCFLNLGQLPYADISAVAGFDFADDGRAMGKVDWDLDGRMDVWLVNRTAPRARFLRNVGDDNNQFVAFRLRGTTCNRDAIGARVTVKLRDQELSETLRGGEGYLSQSSKWVHFGIGDHPAIESVSIRWPGEPTPEVFTEITPNNRYLLVQGNGAPQLMDQHLQREVELAPSRCTVPSESEQARIVLAGRVPLLEISFTDPVGETHQWKPGERPTLINLWASWCAPCVTELEQFASDKRLKVQLNILPLSGDRPEDHHQAIEILNKIGWTGVSGFASPETLDLLDTIQRSLLSHKQQMPVPTSFLIDRRGQLAVIYKGPVDVQQLARDVELCDAGEAEVWAAAVPFLGRWFEKPNAAAHAQMAIATSLINDGSTDLATHYLTGLTSRVDPKTLAEGAEGRMTLAGAQLNLGARLYEQGRTQEAVAMIKGALQYAPNYAKAHFNLGTIWQNEGDPAAARSAFESVLASEPEHAFANFNLGALLAEESPDESRSYYARAIEINPEFTDARYNLGLMEVKAGNLSAAAQQFDAITNYSRHALSYYQLGNLFLSQNQIEKALSSYTAAIEIEPDQLDARTNLAAILLSTNRVDESLPHFAKVAELRSTDPRAQFNFAIGLLQSGEPTQAAERIRKTLELSPDYPQGRVRLAQAILQSQPNNPAAIREAIVLANQSAQTEPQTAVTANKLIRRAERLLEQIGE